MRPSWDRYFLSIAEVVKTRSTCLRRQVGAILVRDRRILTTGYNGQPPNIPHCVDQGGCLREKMNIPSGQRYDMCRAVHAEANAVLQGTIHGVSVDKSTLYCTETPCLGCAKMLIAAGIVRMVILGEERYIDDFAIELLRDSKIPIDWMA